MADVEERTEETKVKNVGNRQVIQERVSTSTSEETARTGASVVWYIAGVLLVLLAFRFVLKLAGANPESGFVDFIYSISGIFVTPFKGIFSTPTAPGDIVKSVFETATLVAIVAYSLLAWGIASLFTLNQKHQ